jgi:Tfp pilus assembly pilus retraction ATPase PilT
MGVPITFLHKFNPDQFEIIKFRKGNDEKDLSINGKCPYFRILIKNKRVQTEFKDKKYNKLQELINVPTTSNSNNYENKYISNIQTSLFQTVHL